MPNLAKGLACSTRRIVDYRKSASQLITQFGVWSLLFCIKPVEELSLDGDKVKPVRRTILADSRHINAPGTLEDALRQCIGCISSSNVNRAELVQRLDWFLSSF